MAGNCKGKRVILIDDSIVRGNTIGPIIKLLRNAGATEVHIRVASPPLLYPCYMGINIPTREELIATKMNARELARHVGKFDKTTYQNKDLPTCKSSTFYLLLNSDSNSIARKVFYLEKEIFTLSQVSRTLDIC